MPASIEPTTLPDGAIVRAATLADLPAMMQIETDREGADDAVDLELTARTEAGLAGMSVVELDGQVLSIATLLDESMRIGRVTVPTGQVEMVATAKDAEGRGYVRALMQRCHDLSQARGHVFQVMIGIPNFYRQFGYAYSIPMHPWATMSPGTAMPSGLETEIATLDNLGECAALQEGVQEHFTVAMPHSADCWRWILSHSSSRQVLVRDSDGRAQAVARVYADDGDVDMGEVASTSVAATEALLAHALSLSSADGSARVNVRPTVPGLSDRVQDIERADWYYVRIADPAGVLKAIAPELLARLHADGRESGEALISFWSSHVKLQWDTATLHVTAGGPMQAPISAGGTGLPLDAIGSLLLGGGAASLEDRFADAYLGRQADLMKVLFPPQATDLLTFYLAS
jgi:predicted N-acetyltransferase YhbS